MISFHAEKQHFKFQIFDLQMRLHWFYVLISICMKHFSYCLVSSFTIINIVAVVQFL